MNEYIDTLELAKLYESQGYYQEAYDMYVSIDRQQSTNQTRAGIDRMKKKLKTTGSAQQGPRQRIFSLLERWLKLVVLKHRLSKYRKIKSRLS